MMELLYKNSVKLKNNDWNLSNSNSECMTMDWYQSDVKNEVSMAKHPLVRLETMIEPFSNVNDNYTFEDNIFKSSLYNKYSDSESNVTFGTSSASTSMPVAFERNQEGYAKSMFRNADAVVQMLRSSSAVGGRR